MGSSLNNWVRMAGRNKRAERIASLRMWFWRVVILVLSVATITGIVRLVWGFGR